MKIVSILILGIWFFGINTQSTNYQSLDETNICLKVNESNLADLINRYRTENGLESIALSSSLTLVAKEHVKDLIGNKPYDEEGLCNPHSWSDKGDWEQCCYNSGKDGACMWNKPRELTSYKGDGYEIVMAQFNSEFPGKEVSAEAALEAWKESEKHNAIILNKDIWKKIQWNAMGIGIFEGFAAVWFGQEIDEAGSPDECP